jgi:hypothetical protein
MKKIIFLLVSVMLSLSLLTPCIADEAAEVENEIATEEEPTAEEDTSLEGATEPVEGAEDVGGAIAPPTEENAAEGTDLSEKLTQIEDMVKKLTEAEDVSDIKELIASSSTWVIIGAGVLIILSVCGIVKSKFGIIIDAFNSIIGFFGKGKNENGDPLTLTDELKSVRDKVVSEVKDAIHNDYGEVAQTMKVYMDELKNRESNEQKLYAIITLFMTNCKISESAKSEILGILADVKKYEGDISTFVSQAQEAIDRKKAEEAVSETPHLDRMLEEDYMELG